jgi:HEAT repeat protein
MNGPAPLSIVVAIAAVVVLAPGPAAQGSATTEELLERFRAEPVFWRQFEIAQELAARQDTRVLVALEPLLIDDDRHIRGNAAFVFARLGDSRGLAVIRGILADRSDRPLGQGIPRAPSNPGQTRWWMREQIRADRYHAVHMLGELRDSSGVDILVPLLGDPDVNYHAAWALGLIGDVRATGPLIGALEDPSALMRVSAIQALEALDAREAVPKLRGLLGDQELPAAGPRVPVSDTAKAAIRRLLRQPQE